MTPFQQVMLLAAVLSLAYGILVVFALGWLIGVVTAVAVFSASALAARVTERVIRRSRA